MEGQFQEKNGIVATESGRLTALVGADRENYSVGDVEQTLINDNTLGANVQVLGDSFRSESLDVTTVVMPTDDPETATEMLSDMEAMEGVEYAEFQPVFRHVHYGMDAFDAETFPEQVAQTVEQYLTALLKELRQVKATIHGAISDEGGDPRASEQYGIDLVNAPDAIRLLPENDYTATAVVLDSGTDYEHIDLADQFGENKGYDFGDDDPDPMPSVIDHGTHVGGTVAATVGNGEGIAGTAGIDGVRLLSAKIFGADATSLGMVVAEAIRWSADQGADVVNMSIGGTGQFGLPSDTVERAIEYADENGTVCVAATGNSGTNTVQFPANHPKCVGVTAVDENEQFPGFPDTGTDVDVTAPGVAVLSTVFGNDYGEKTGTSMASPHAAGVVTLGAKAAAGTASAPELRQMLKDTARELSGLTEEQQGAGLVDAKAMVESAIQTVTGN